MTDSDENTQEENFDVAVIGISGRFPGASNVNEYWKNLIEGKESVHFFSEDELRTAGVSSNLLLNPRYIKASPIIEDFDCFDARFFGYNPREAASMDPQQRLLLEECWNALEDAGYAANGQGPRVGVYVSSAMNTYLLFSGLLPNFSTDYLHTLIGNDKDFLATRVSYKLNLHGPSVTIQSACSSSLVAIHTAAQSLLNEECDIALAGGVSVRVPQHAGYLYEEESVFSKDGHCRPFDAMANGTIFGSGVGVVVLKRYTDAIADGDAIRAVIKGSAVNNDGAAKSDYTAPSINAQAEVIAEALAAANVDARTIEYVEAHGTGTFLGDPIEVTALTKAYRTFTEDCQYCSLGSVKGNIGHLDAAAGVSGFIKAVLALENRVIPKSINFENSNPQIDFASSPFSVADQTTTWQTSQSVRRAAITSLGIGGTNAHVILEEPPKKMRSDANALPEIVLLSARSEGALKKRSEELIQYLQQNPSSSLSDVAYTLRTGRKHFEYREAFAARDVQETIEILQERIEKTSYSKVPEKSSSIVFLFPGNGSAHAGMCQGLYRDIPEFRKIADTCCQQCNDFLPYDLRELIFKPGSSPEETQALLEQPGYAMPALFVTEYALAKLWISWGIVPQVMVGHSIGEYVAACLSGVLKLKDALRIVCYRGILCDRLPKGAMLSITADENSVRNVIKESGIKGISLAALNAPSSAVISGQESAIEQMDLFIEKKGYATRRLRVSVAYHSDMIDPILNEFKEILKSIETKAPEIPFFSNVTGELFTEEQARDQFYWADHLRQGVRFSQAISTLLEQSLPIFLEVGPGTVLSSLVRQHINESHRPIAIASLRHPLQELSDIETIKNALADLFMSGIEVHLDKSTILESSYRTHLPRYPFERDRHWFKGKSSIQAQLSNAAPKLFLPSWKQAGIISRDDAKLPVNQSWLIFSAENQFTASIVDFLKKAQQKVIEVIPGEEFSYNKTLEGISVSLPLDDIEDYQRLFHVLKDQNIFPENILHLWNMRINGSNSVKFNEDLSFSSLFLLSQAYSKFAGKIKCMLSVITSELFKILGTEEGNPLQACALGPVGVLPKETEIFNTRLIDFPVIAPHNVDAARSCLLTEHCGIQKPTGSIIAVRGNYRWEQDFNEYIKGNLSDSKHAPFFKKNGTYCITGGLGGIGLQLAKYISAEFQANVALLARTGLSDDHGANIRPDARKKLDFIHACQGHGGNIAVFLGDVTDLDSLEKAFTSIKDRFGDIDGVIHAAGVAEENFSELKSLHSARKVLSPKVEGTVNLVSVLENNNIHDLLIFSSIQSLTPTVGQIDYASANAFVDSLAQHHRHTLKITSINWPGWKDTGMAIGLDSNEEIREIFISVDEGLTALHEICQVNTPQMVVSKLSIKEISQVLDRNLGGYQRQDNVDKPVPANGSLKHVPGNETEEQLLEIWKELLGYSHIGLHDSFLDLGGNSLLATRLITRVRDRFNINLSIRDFFNTPTIKQISEIVIQQAANEDQCIRKQKIPAIRRISRSKNLEGANK